ncbi:hypothetical protein WAI453_000288 [Rhynchosporium graminicola]
MKLLILSLLVSGAVSAAVGAAGLKARELPKACDCNIIFPNAQAVYTYGIPTLPGKTQLSANYYTVDSHFIPHTYVNACRVTWDRGHTPKDCSTWKQAAGPDGPNCPRSIFVKGRIECGPIY